MTVPNVGDLLMLSQVAWKTGRAFTASRQDAPPDFQVVQTAITSLAQALKLLAETLHAKDGPGLIPQSVQRTQDGVAVILSSCKRTIHDLDSLVDRYQVIRKHRTVDGFAIERSWSDLVLAQHDTVIWTTEGGTLHDLSSLLQMHTKSILLLTEAVQSGSPSQLEAVVTPMAERFDSMYDLPGTLEDQLEEVFRFVRELSLASPLAPSPPLPPRNPARSPTADISDSRESFKAALPSRSTSNNTSPTLAGPSPPTSPTSPTSPRERVREFSFGGSSSRDSTSSYASSTSSTPSRGSLNTRHMLISATESLPLPRTPELSEPMQSDTSSLTLFPPQAMRPSSAQSTPGISRVRSSSTLSPFPAQQESITKLHRSSTSTSQRTAFEKDAFRNSAVLCDVRGTLVEYSQQTQPDPDYPSDITNIEMVPACDTCRIAVVRKRLTDSKTKSVRVVTSIWAISDDNNVRVELAMSEETMYIPYSSFFSPAKISITVPCELRFHDVRYGNRMLRTARTSWVNFIFSAAAGATLFQNEIMGRTLLATLRTSKTMRIHDGPMAAFAYAEQMCALENLRVWEDSDSGAVIGLVHFAASFKPGYLAFYINSSSNTVRVQDTGAREVKIRGLRVPIEHPGRAMRKDSVIDDSDAGTLSSSPHAAGEEKSSAVPLPKKARKTEIDRKKVISGARIEFATEAEKRAFLDLVQEYQRPGSLCEVPDLLGVN